MRDRPSASTPLNNHISKNHQHLQGQPRRLRLHLLLFLLLKPPIAPSLCQLRRNHSKREFALLCALLLSKPVAVYEPARHVGCHVIRAIHVMFRLLLGASG
jgi:hypothetical protein